MTRSVRRVQTRMAAKRHWGKVTERRMRKQSGSQMVTSFQRGSQTGYG